MAQPQSLTIGQLAKATGFGVGVETIRFYERKGLLAEPPRTSAGYRLYPLETLERLRFIRRAQGLGFTLAEISDLLDLRVDNVTSCGLVEDRVTEKLKQVAAKIEDLRKIESALVRLVAACRAKVPTGECPIIEELEH